MYVYGGVSAFVHQLVPGDGCPSLWRCIRNYSLEINEDCNHLEFLQWKGEPRQRLGEMETKRSTHSAERRAVLLKETRNHTIEIREINPSHLIIIDAVEFSQEPGSFIIVDKNQIDTFNFSTHTMPISFLINYLEDSVGCNVLTMGIQPKDMTLVDTISTPAQQSMDELVELIVNNI